MGHQRILIADESAAMRETISVLLAADYDVACLTPARLDSAVATPPDLLIAAPRVRPLLPAGLQGVPFLALTDAQDPHDRDAQERQERQERDDYVLSRRFTARQLRARVSLALGSRPLERTLSPPPWRARSPFVTEAATPTLAAAIAHPLPLHLHGEPGTGRRALAHAVHQACGGGAMIAFDGSELSLRRVDVAAGQPATLFVGSIDRLAPRGQNELLEALDGIGGFTRPGHTTLRVITSACADLEELVENHSFSHELYYKLSALVVHQPPLRERPEDIPALVRMLSAELAARLGLGTVRFTSAALRCLGDYLWPGNIDELEAVLGRTLSIRGAGPLDRDDLLFEGTSLQGRHKATGVALSPPPARSQSAASIEVAGAHLNGQADLAQQLDMVINELAHEFRNPLVTIKSFAQHCNKALKKGDEQRFAALTGEAVDRMDQTMENLLHFTRLGHPAARDVGLDTLLEPVFSAQKEALAIEKRGLEYDAPPSIVTHVDPDQTAYAFDNLLRALTRGLTPGESLSAQYCAPGAMLLQLSAGAKHLGDQLSGLIDHADSESSLPLGVAIANAVLERNGVHMSVSKHADPTTVMIHFPVVEKVEAGVDQNGTSTRAHRR